MKSVSHSTFLCQWVRGLERRMYVVSCSWDSFSCLNETRHWFELSFLPPLHYIFPDPGISEKENVSNNVKENTTCIVEEDGMSHDPVGQMSAMVFPSGFIFNLPVLKLFGNPALFSTDLKFWHIYRWDVQIVSTFSIKHGSTSCADSVM